MTNIMHLQISSLLIYSNNTVCHHKLILEFHCVLQYIYLYGKIIMHFFMYIVTNPFRICISPCINIYIFQLCIINKYIKLNINESQLGWSTAITLLLQTYRMAYNIRVHNAHGICFTYYMYTYKCCILCYNGMPTYIVLIATYEILEWLKNVRIRFNSFIAFLLYIAN